MQALRSIGQGIRETVFTKADLLFDALPLGILNAIEQKAADQGEPKIFQILLVLPCSVVPSCASESSRKTGISAVESCRYIRPESLASCINSIDRRYIS